MWWGRCCKHMQRGVHITDWWQVGGGLKVSLKTKVHRNTHLTSETFLQNKRDSIRHLSSALLFLFFKESRFAVEVHPFLPPQSWGSFWRRRKSWKSVLFSQNQVRGTLQHRDAQFRGQRRRGHLHFPPSRDTFSPQHACVGAEASTERAEGKNEPRHCETVSHFPDQHLLFLTSRCPLWLPGVSA